MFPISAGRAIVSGLSVTPVRSDCCTERWAVRSPLQQRQSNFQSVVPLQHRYARGLFPVYSWHKVLGNGMLTVLTGRRKYILSTHGVSTAFSASRRATVSRAVVASASGKRWVIRATKASGRDSMRVFACWV